MKPSTTRPPGEPRRGDEERAFDVRLGALLRQRRALRGLSQGRVAELLGLTFQQIQKYERGVNRVSASRLIAYARALGATPLEVLGAALDSAEPLLPETKRADLEMVRVFAELGQSERALVLALMRALRRPRGGALSEAAE